MDGTIAWKVGPDIDRLVQAMHTMMRQASGFVPLDMQGKQLGAPDV